MDENIHEENSIVFLEYRYARCVGPGPQSIDNECWKTIMGQLKCTHTSICSIADMSGEHEVKEETLFRREESSDNPDNIRLGVALLIYNIIVLMEGTGRTFISSTILMK